MSAPTSARAHAETAVQRLEKLAAKWPEEWNGELEAELYRLSGQPTRQATWRAFELLAEWISLRDGVNDGRTDWREVDPEITGPDRSDAAYEIACDQVDAAARTLIGGWR